MTELTEIQETIQALARLLVDMAIKTDAILTLLQEMEHKLEHLEGRGHII